MEVNSEYHFDIPNDVTLSEYVLQNCRQYGDRAALIDGFTNATYTYAEVCTNVIRCSNNLVRLGLKPDMNVCILLSNCIQYPIIYLATIHAGAVAVPLSYVSSKYELEYYLNDCEATFIVTTSSRSDVIRKIQETKSDVRIKHVIVVDDDIEGCTSFNSLLEEPKSTEYCGGNTKIVYNSIRNDASLRGAATICYSSGTTGLPKGCQQSHFSYIANVAELRHVTSDMFMDGREVTVTLMVMSHMYGQLMYLILGLVTGTKHVILPNFQMKIYLQLIQKHQATVIHIVPPVMSRLLQCSTSELECLKSIRYLFNSAAPLLNSTVKQFKHILPHIRITQGYGMTEFMFSFLSSAHTWKYGSVGKLLPNCRARIVDVETGRILGPRQDGEIRIKSPSLMNGYLKRHQAATAESYDEEGWFKTGDIGNYDTEYNFFIVSRAKDLLKYNGYQVSPTELESIIVQHPDVKDAAVIGVPDDVSGDLPKAYVVRKPSQFISEHDIAVFVQERVAPYKRLRGGVTFINEIPKSESGKILRTELRKIEQARIDQTNKKAMTSKL